MFWKFINENNSPDSLRILCHGHEIKICPDNSNNLSKKSEQFRQIDKSSWVNHCLRGEDLPNDKRLQNCLYCAESIKSPLFINKSKHLNNFFIILTTPSTAVTCSRELNSNQYIVKP